MVRPLHCQGAEVYAWYNHGSGPNRSSAAVPEPESKSMPEVVAELWELTKDYARQETVDPLKGVGRYLGYGAAGALLLALGVILLMLAGLRALQTETGDALDGSLSWLPYLIVLVVASGLVAWAVTRISKKHEANR
jgi:hypothetical protein